MPGRRKTSLSQMTRSQVAIKLKRKNETDYERLLRLANVRLRAAARRAAESPEAHYERLKFLRERGAKQRKSETAEQRAARLETTRRRNLAQRQLSNDEYERRMYREFECDTSSSNLSVTEQGDLLVFKKSKRNTVIAVSTKLSNNEKLKSNVESVFKSVEAIKEEPKS